MQQIPLAEQLGGGGAREDEIAREQAIEHEEPEVPGVDLGRRLPSPSLHRHRARHERRPGLRAELLRHPRAELWIELE